MHDTRISREGTVTQSEEIGSESENAERETASKSDKKRGKELKTSLSGFHPQHRKIKGVERPAAKIRGLKRCATWEKVSF